MKKVVFDKWFMLAFLLIISLSAFSFVAYKKTRAICSATKVCKDPEGASEKGQLLWDGLSRQFSSVSFQ
jgi:hypothetical protein